MAEHLLLKWGTLKGWNLESDRSLDIMRRYAEIGMSFGAMQQRDTPEQKQLICDLIDSLNGEIVNDWSGEKLSKAAAKDYVMNY